MNHSINIADFNTVCRICLESKNYMIKSISPMIIYMLETCTSVQDISNEKMPQQICIDCYGQLKNAFNFKQQCIISFRVLSEIILQSENNVKQENTTEMIVIKTEYHTDEESDTKKEISNETATRVELNIKNEAKDENTINSSDTESNNFVDNNCEKFSEEENNCESLLEDSFQIEQTVNKKKQNPHVKKVALMVTCDICGKKIRKRYLRGHQKSHSDNKPYECDICHVRFKRSFEVNKHKKIVHSTGNQGKEICFICGKLVIHSLKSHLQMHKELNDNGQFKCDKCGKIYTREDCLRSHVRLKHSADGIRTYTCNICHKTIKTSLSQHMKYVHSDGKREHVCQYCDKSYKKKGDLSRHVQTAHLDVRPHSCTMCDRTFHTRRILVNHMRTHTGERPFSCNICGKSFSFQVALATHMKVHSK